MSYRWLIVFSLFLIIAGCSDPMPLSIDAMRADTHTAGDAAGPGQDAADQSKGIQVSSDDLDLFPECDGISTEALIHVRLCDFTDGELVRELGRRHHNAIVISGDDTFFSFWEGSSRQEALEGYEGHGLFTYVLSQGITGKADMDRDGFIQTPELALYVEQKVPEIAESVFKRKQYPTTTRTGNAFPIGKIGR